MSYTNRIKEQLSGKTICMYPFGIAARSTMQKLKINGIEIDFFSDSNSELWGNEFKGKSCIPKTQLAEMEQSNLVVIVESLYYKEIKQDLQEHGIENIMRIYPEKFLTDCFLEEQKDTLKERAGAALDICADEKSKQVFQFLIDSWYLEEISDDHFEKIYDKDQYFDSSVISIGQDEVFVDGGAYIGDTAEKFAKFSHGRYEKMHLFELDPEIYDRLQLNIKDCQGGKG